MMECVFCVLEEPLEKHPVVTVSAGYGVCRLHLPIVALDARNLLAAWRGRVKFMASGEVQRVEAG